jgi:hypothetical protein
MEFAIRNLWTFAVQPLAIPFQTHPCDAHPIARNQGVDIWRGQGRRDVFIPVGDGVGYDG